MNKFRLNFTLLIILFSISFLFLACDTGSFNKKSSKSEYDKKVEQELNSGIKNDDIFMTFRFGDSEKDVKNKFKLLRRDEKISLNEDREYYYEYVFKVFAKEKGYATFKTNYHNGKLYEIRIMVEPYASTKNYVDTFGYEASYDYVQSSNELLFAQLKLLYFEKYGISVTRENVLYDDDECWINGNRQIEISLADGFVNIIYTDLSVLKQIKEETKKSMSDQATSTKTDI